MAAWLRRRRQLTDKRPVAPIDYTKELQRRCWGCLATMTSRRTPEEVDQHEAALKQHGKKYEFHRYDGAGHGFFYYDRRPVPAGAGDGRLGQGVRLLSAVSQELASREAGLDDAPGPGPVREAIGSLLHLAEQGVLVEFRQLAVFEHHLAADDDRVHVLLTRRIRPVSRSDRGRARTRGAVRIEQEQVSELADFELPSSLPRPSAAAPPSAASRSVSRALMTRGSLAAPFWARRAELQRLEHVLAVVAGAPSVARLTAAPARRSSTIGAMPLPR